VAKAPKRRRRDPLLDSPGARVNPVHAVQLGFWEIDEAAAFLIGFDRKFMNLEAVQGPLKGTPAAAEFLRVKEAIERAIRLERLRHFLTPADCVQWANQLGFEPPADLVSAAQGPSRIAEIQPHPEAVANNVVETARQSALTQRLNTAQRINAGLLRKWYHLVPGQATESDMTNAQHDLQEEGVPVNVRTLWQHFVEGAGLNARKRPRGGHTDS
jgi:hypothetical protein